MLKSASRRIADIYRHSLENWGREQARDYIDGLFDLFDAVAAGERNGRSIPKALGLSGRYIRYRRHFVFWIEKGDDRIAIISVLHDRMKMVDRLPEDIRASDASAEKEP